MKRIFKTLKNNQKKILEMENVVGVGVGLKEKAGRTTEEESVIIYVSKKMSKNELRSYDVIPEKIEDSKTDVVEIGEMKLLVNTDKYRPVKPGCSIGHYAISAGTLGAIVRDRKTGQKLFLSNNHVLANVTDGRDGRALEGDVVLQPGAYDGGNFDNDVVARLYKYAPITKMYSESECPVAAAAVYTANNIIQKVRPSYAVKLVKTSNKNNIVDAALAKPIDDNFNSEIIEIGKVTGKTEPYLGQKIKKSGRTTGYTEGIVKAVGVTMRVSLGGNNYGVFSDQVLSDIKSAPGDSGSLILDTSNRAVGLLFAGSETTTLFNRISNVMNELDIEF